MRKGPEANSTTGIGSAPLPSAHFAATSFGVSAVDDTT